MHILLVHSDAIKNGDKLHVDLYIVERRNFTIDYDVPVDKLDLCFKRDWKKSQIKLKKTKSIIL